MPGEESLENQLPVEGSVSGPVVPTPYDDFVEGVAARDIARQVGGGSGEMARIFDRQGDDGNELHIVGEKGTVDRLGGILERGGYKVSEWHVRRPADPQREAERVGPELEKLVDSTPPSILPKLGAAIERAREQAGLPRSEFISGILEAGDRVVDGIEGRVTMPDGFEPRPLDKEDKEQKNG